MKPPAALVSLVLLGVSLAACGDDDAVLDAAIPDAPPGTNPDAGPPDAAAPDADQSPLGAWRVVSLVSGADTILTTDTDVGGELVRVNGLLQLGATEGSFTLAEVGGGRLSTQDGNVDTLTLDPGFTTLALTHSSPVPMAFDAAAGTLSLVLGPTSTLNFVRHAHMSSETIALAGQVSVEDDGVPGNMTQLLAPRVAVVFLLRGVGGGTEFIAVPGDDVPLPGFGVTEAQTATFDLSRVEGALGVERITFGTTGFLSVGLIVVYDDRDLDGQLDNLFTSCGDVDVDCVRGVSPIVLGYRIGASQELADSPYQYLMSGWTWSVVAPDSRLGTPPRLGLVSLDPTTTALPIDVVVTENPTTMPASIPALTFPP